MDDISAHSARKGASTYLTSGYVCGPMQQADNIRFIKSNLILLFLPGSVTLREVHATQV